MQTDIFRYGDCLYFSTIDLLALAVGYCLNEEPGKLGDPHRGTRCGRGGVDRCDHVRRGLARTRRQVKTATNNAQKTHKLMMSLHNICQSITE